MVDLIGLKPMKTPLYLHFAILAGGSAIHAQAASITLTAVADTVVFHRDGTFAYNNTNYGTATQLDTSQFGGAIWAMSYLRFDLSSIPAGSTIDSAVFQVTKTTTAAITTPAYPVVRNDTITSGRFGSYGLLDVAGNTSQVWDETALTADGLGAERVSGLNPQLDSTTRTIDFNTATETLLSSATVVQVSGTPVVSFLQGRLDATSNPGLATIIIDFMEDASGSARGYSFASRESTTLAAVPTLTINYTEPVPEPSVVAAGALGLLTLLRRRR